MLFSTMFEEIPQKKPYNQDPVGNRQIRNHQHMIKMLNHLLTKAPAWDEHDHKVGMVGLPFQALYDWPMGTASGYAVFQDPTVNALLKKVLNQWGKFLSSPESASTLGKDEHGWFGSTGLKDLTDVANGATGGNQTFEEMFHCDPKDEHFGYKSWDDFFTRRFRFEDGVRPVASPDDDSVIANACESKTYKVAHNVKARDKFWLKGQPYSVVDMLDHDDLAHQFIGGTVYQAFLSSLSYHRWHAPVSGKIVKTKVVDGTYFSEPPYTGFESQAEYEVAGQSVSQEYLSALATRGIIYIEADNKDIGLMAVVPIGMVEVSTCDITVKAGDHIKKGDQLGMFHFGGSTHCLLFRKGVKVEGFPEPHPKENVPIRSALARVIS